MDKCKNCRWLDWSKKCSVGYECVNPNITHRRLGHIKNPSNQACKNGFESNAEFLEFLKDVAEEGDTE